MMDNLVCWPARLRSIQIREDFLSICGNHCAAALLAELDGYAAQAYDLHDLHINRQKPASSIDRVILDNINLNSFMRDFLWFFNEKEIEAGMGLLEQMGFISRWKGQPLLIAFYTAKISEAQRNLQAHQHRRRLGTPSSRPGIRKLSQR